ncbi:MAG: oligosaccharide flippase family protein [Butyrivibrio sp.]|nr:oligosaccharide flippase family protein [Butyrivibrio sp.]
MVKDLPSIKKNYIYILAYKILTIITPLITAPYVARVLGADNIGIFSFTNAHVAYFVLFGVFGLSSYSQFECAKRRDDKIAFSQFCVESILTRFIFMGTSIVIYCYLYVFSSSEYSMYYAVLTVVLLSNLIDFTWICEGLEKYKIISIRNSVVRLISVFAVFIFVKDKSDLLWYLLINSLVVFCGNVALIPYVKKFIYIKELSKVKIIPHVKSAMLFFLPAVASTILNTTDKLMIGWLTNDITQNGYYEQAVKIEMMIFMVFSSLYTSMRGRMAYIYSTGKDNPNIYINKALAAILFLSMPICVGMIQLADVFVPWFFGDGYDGVIVLLQIMAGWIIVKSFSNCIWELAIFFAGDISRATLIVWIGVLFNIIFNPFAISRMGAVGAAIVSLLSEVMVLLIVLYMTSGRIKFSNLKDDAIKELLAATFMFGGMCLIESIIQNNTMGVLVEILVGIIIYLIIIFIMKVKIASVFLKLIWDKLGTH